MHLARQGLTQRGRIPIPHAASPTSQEWGSRILQPAPPQRATNTAVATVPVGIAPQGGAVSPDGTRAYVTNGIDDTVSVIDTATNTVVATVPVGDNPLEVVVSPDGTRAYITNANSDTVSVIRL